MVCWFESSPGYKAPPESPGEFLFYGDGTQMTRIFMIPYFDHAFLCVLRENHLVFVVK